AYSITVSYLLSRESKAGRSISYTVRTTSASQHEDTQSFSSLTSKLSPPLLTINDHVILDDFKKVRVFEHQWSLYPWLGADFRRPVCQGVYQQSPVDLAGLFIRHHRKRSEERRVGQERRQEGTADICG